MVPSCWNLREIPAFPGRDQKLNRPAVKREMRAAENIIEFTRIPLLDKPGQLSLRIVDTAGSGYRAVFMKIIPKVDRGRYHEHQNRQSGGGNAGFRPVMQKRG